MRDERFTWSQDGQVQARRRGEVERAFVALPADALSRHLIHRFDDVLSDTEFADGPTRLARILREAADACVDSSPLLEKHFQAALTHTDGTDGQAMQLLLGRLLANQAARTLPNAPALERALSLFEKMWTAREAFVIAFGEAAAYRRADWANVLDSFPTTADEWIAPGYFEGPETAARIRAEQAARANGLVQYVWGRENQCLLHDGWLDRVRILAALEPARVARLLDEVPLREIRTHILRFLHVKEDRVLVLELLKVALPVFVDGRWTGRSLALELIDEGIRYAEELTSTLAYVLDLAEVARLARVEDARAALPDALVREMPAWLEDLFKAALTRSDGREICLQMAAEFVRRAIRPSPRRGDFDGPRTALDALVRASAENPFRILEVRASAAIGAPVPPTGEPHGSWVVAGACLTNEHAALWSWYLERLVGIDPELTQQTRSPTPAWVFAVVSRSLLQAGSPLDRWQEAWRHCYSQRRAARFPNPRHDQLAPSVHVLRVAQHALVLKARSTLVNDETAMALWAASHEAARTLMTNYPEHLDAPEVVFVDGFAAGAYLFEPNWSRVLDGALDDLRTYNDRMVQVAARLIHAGRERREVLACFRERGLDPVCAAKELRDWLERVGDRGVGRLFSAIAAIVSNETLSGAPAELNPKLWSRRPAK